MSMHTIVVATDGSGASLEAVAEAARLAAGWGAGLHIAAVLSGTPPAGPAAEAAELALARAAAVAGRHGSAAETYVLSGRTAPALAELSRRLGADVVFLGPAAPAAAARAAHPAGLGAVLAPTA